MTQILSDVDERERLRGHDSQLLIIRTITIGDEVNESFDINTTRERKQYAEVAEELEAIEDPTEKLTKGIASEAVAEAVFGTRNPYYVKRVEGAMKFDGPINAMLSNGAVVDCLGGLVYKTRSLEDFIEFVTRYKETTLKGTDRVVQRKIQNFNEVMALLERRNPSITETTADARATLHSALTERVVIRLKAIEPPKRVGKR